MKLVSSLACTIAIASILFVAVSAQSMKNGYVKDKGGGSCAKWFATCKERCLAAGPGNCSGDSCPVKLAECRRTGCWAENPNFGGSLHCGLSR